MRCLWAESSDLIRQYHDLEWGVESHDEAYLFEMLVLESFQAGLSWNTILVKRENFRQALSNFDPIHIASYDSDKIESLLSDEGIIRHRKKIEATIHNAQVYNKLKAEGFSLNAYLWNFVDFKPVRNEWYNMNEVPSTSELSIKVAKGLKKLGFKFMGPTTTYAYLQAVGIINDHLKECRSNKDDKRI